MGLYLGSRTLDGGVGVDQLVVTGIVPFLTKIRKQKF